MNDVGNLCDPSYANKKGFETPLQILWSILAMLYRIYYTKSQESHKKQDLVGKSGWLLVWYICDMMHLDIMDDVGNLCDPSYP